MTTLLIRILLLFLAVWILWQFLKMFLVKNRTGPSSGNTSTSGKKMVKDPLCGMYMDPRLAVKYETKNGVFYFCSEECKNKFLQAYSKEKSGAPPSGE